MAAISREDDRRDYEERKKNNWTRPNARPYESEGDRIKRQIEANERIIADCRRRIQDLAK